MPESEIEASSKENGVRELQANLFPPSPRGGGSFLSNFLLKFTPSNNDDDEDARLPKIKETISVRELFSISKEQVFNFQSPRWPTECQVLEERVAHISYTPPVPEPYYVPSGNEAQPKPVGEECGIIVYQYYPISAVNYFSRSSVGGSKYLLPTCPSPEEDTLRFESRFECGNLAKAIRITPNYYELYLRTDLYTNKHMQWYYFKVTNMRKNFLYRFSIVNLAKDDSLYNEGMRPLMYSTKDSQLHSIGWRHFGDNVTYFCNDNVTAEDPEQPMTYTLTFTVEFPHESDEIYFAHSYPYTYSDLQDYLMEMTQHPVKSTFSTLRLLCKTLAGNNVYYVTITSPPDGGNEEKQKKKAIVLTARVHPGETPSSWMMKGILDFLTGDSSAARELRDKFIFKIVPMLNPDGVIVGNNRCSLTGRDLNRQYRTVIRETYPSIWYTKLMVRRLLEECGVAMYCDLHAHSRKHNIFIYGCENRKNSDRRLYEQVFPLMLHKNAADKDCHFRIHRAKEGTGRVVMWMMGIANSYTLEASFGGSLLGTRTESHFSTQDYEQAGKAFCQTLLDFYDDGPFKERLRTKIHTRLLKEGSRADEPTNIKLSDYSSDEGDTSSSSSNEAGRDLCEVFLTAPPPSPAIGRKPPPKPPIRKKPMQTVNKSPNVPRKTLPLCKTILELPIVSKDLESSESDFESDDLVVEVKPQKEIARKKKKKKAVKKRQKVVMNQKVKEAEEEDVTAAEGHLQIVSLLDITPANSSKRAHSWHRTMISTPCRTLSDNRKITTQQLIEVQAKLNSLRNRLWFGVGGGDVEGPLSWGTRSVLVQETSALTNNNKGNKAKKKVTKLEKRAQKKTKKEDEGKAGKKQQNGYKTVKLRLPSVLEDWERFRLKRQSTAEYGVQHQQKTSILRKSKSLPNTAIHFPTITNADSGSDDDDKAKKKKKKLTTKNKKKKTKSTKKAKTQD